MTFIRRNDEDRNDLFAWWDGGKLTADTQFSCEANEAIVVFDEEAEEQIATLGPGRHALPKALEPYVGREDLLVIFVTTGPMRVEAGGALEDVEDEPWLEARVQMTVTDPMAAIELLPLIDEDEAPEDWLAEELILAVSRAAQDVGGGLEGLRAASAKIAADATAFANEVFADLGFKMGTPELAFSDSEDAD